MGQYLRKTYGPVSNDDVYIRSTNIYRTIETARGVFVGWNDAQVKNFASTRTIDGSKISAKRYL